LLAEPLLRSTGQAAGGERDGPPGDGGSAQPSALYTLAQLSALVTSAMDAIAPADALSRRLREERERSAFSKLSALGTIAVGGRVIDDDKIQEWRGDRQSTFALRCRRFVDANDEKRMKSLVGQDVVVAGHARTVSGYHDGGGVLAFEQCRILSGAADLAKATLAEDGGLALRPPTPEEAYAGPDKGLNAKDVAKVVYKAVFTTGIDGFGNGYTSRSEDTYVLLRDGSAYEHHWPFPFTDVNLGLVKGREPDRQYRWETSGDKLVLTRTGGKRQGERIELSGTRTLMPLDSGTQLDHAYRFLNVGIGGAVRERGYAFRSDGTVELTRQGWVGSNVGYGSPGTSVTGPGFSYSANASGQGFLAVAGKSGKSNARYRIDGHLLELTGEDGSIERHFIARFDSDASRKVPEELYLDGQVLWSRDTGSGKP
jgi:hypothetical protein